jgi:hypothetical protein
MLSLIAVFWMFIILFAVIGAMRGWAKELLVAASVILGLFLNAILETYITPYRNALFEQPGGTQFLIRAGLLVLLAFFGYQSPSLGPLRDKVARERLQDTLLGLVMGAFNGYLLIGSLWFYLHSAGYPASVITPPPVGSELAEHISKMITFMAPAVLTVPYVYFAVGVAFVFIIVVFV